MRGICHTDHHLLAAGVRVNALAVFIALAFWTGGDRGAAFSLDRFLIVALVLKDHLMHGGFNAVAPD